MFDLLSRMRDPSIFQGNLRYKNYFEGWYFKQVGFDGAKIAVIPGISLSEDSHAFIQVFDGRLNKSYYFEYPIEEFKTKKKPFEVKIGNNSFSYTGIELNLDGYITGSLRYSRITPYRWKWYERGVMGWYGYVPFLETNHGLLSLDHRVDGDIYINEDKHIFRDCKGYIEKDWGSSFPSSWIWMQSNSFKDQGASFMFSIAVIPWLSSSFIGHLALLRFNKHTINLSTYRGGKVTKLSINKEGVFIHIQTRAYLLEINAIQGKSVSLKSPEKGLMTGRTIESINSKIDVSLTNYKGNVLFSDTGIDAGLEIMDDNNELIEGLRLDASDIRYLSK
jgi:hypothetical protein